jgi:hypothetical protein
MGSVRVRALRLVAIALAVVYVAWNAFWLSLGHVAPSLMVALTGLPCPTTGMTRALRALGAGNWQLSLACNPLTVPILALCAFSLGVLALQLVGRKQLRLHPALAWAWLALLAAGEIAKLLGNPVYW